MKHEFTSHETFPIPQNEIWTWSIDFLEGRVSTIDAADKDQGILKTKEFNVPYKGFQFQSIYADCGKPGGLNVFREIIGYYEIFIAESLDSRTTIRTVPHYRASLWAGNNFKGWISCESRGYLEQLLIDDLRAKIKKFYPTAVLISQPANGTDDESDKKSIALLPKIQENDNKVHAEPERNLSPETERKESPLSYETTLQESDKFRNESGLLKINKEYDNTDKHAEDVTLSSVESPPELTVDSDNETPEKSLLNGIDEDKTPDKVAKDENYYFQLGHDFLQSSKYPEAIDAYLQATRIKPDSAYAQYNLGVAYGELGKYPEAMDAFTQAIRINPDIADAHYRLAIIYEMSGKYKDAIDAYKQAIRINPSSAEAYHDLGYAYGESGRYQEAVDAYTQAIRIKPDYSDAQYNLGVAYGELGMYQEAVDAYKQAIRIKPDYADAHYNVGYEYGRLGKYPEAIDAYKEAIRIRSDSADAHLNLGLTYLLTGDKDSALDEYNILKDLDKKSADTLKRKMMAGDQNASLLVYTIQISSQKSLDIAQKNFNSILRSLTSKNLNLLRIEKIGEYYTVRLGKFESNGTAKKFIQGNKPQLSEAIILKAYIKNERIIRLHE
ncbi:MAG: tetratricopeptide repeat protein [Nitrospiraceae bacterium]|nr:MAG: tetratricopeptide repeat protein [Nitrospiraceae bacterium]